jgi:hypothetical protein
MGRATRLQASTTQLYETRARYSKNKKDRRPGDACENPFRRLDPLSLKKTISKSSMVLNGTVFVLIFKNWKLNFLKTH